MPELRDVTVYVERLGALVTGAPLVNVRIKGPFLLRSFDPPISEAKGRRILSVSRLSEIIGVRVADVILDGAACAHLIGKGGKRRSLPLWEAIVTRTRISLRRSRRWFEAKTQFRVAAR